MPYVVVYNGQQDRAEIGELPPGEVLSHHRTLKGAQRAFRKDNWWLFNRRKAQQMGLTDTRTFQEIYAVDKDGKCTENFRCDIEGE